jgi:MFS family permease
VCARLKLPSNFNHSLRNLQTAFGSLPAYLPTIIESIGYTSIHAQGFSSPPYLSAWLFCILASFASDRVGNRGLFITGFACAGAAGYLILATVHTAGVRYFATYLVCAGVFPATAMTFTWVTDNQGTASKRGAGLAIFGMVGQVGPILGARLYPKEDGPIYKKGMATCAGLLLLAACTAQILSFSMRIQNSRRDGEFGKASADEVPEDVADLGDAHPSYRYIL